MPRPKKKVFVLDTNVILHDSSCLHHFEEHDVVVPIVVLEELDQFKKGNETLNYHAREFLRALDALSGDKLFNGGVDLGPGQGKIGLRLESEFHPDLTPSFSPTKPDHHILNAAYQIATGKPARQAILVSKDVNLRMKAKSIGLMAQDYRNDQVADVSALYTGSRTEEKIDDELIDRLYRDPFAVDPAELDLDDAPRPNEYLILRNGRKSALATFDAGDNAVRHVDKLSAYGIVPRNAEQTFALHALLTPGQLLWPIPYTDLAITREGLIRGAFFTLRLAAVVVTAALMTLTTAPLELTEGLERLLNPLRRFGFPAHELAMMVTISLRFIPVLIDEAERLRKAQLARGADFSGGPIRRARSLIPLLVPLFISAFDRADRLALAMESRCYRGGIDRTSYHELRFARRDLIAGLTVVAVVAAIRTLPDHWPF